MRTMFHQSLKILKSKSGFFGFVISAAGDDNNCSDASASTNRN